MVAQLGAVLLGTAPLGGCALVPRELNLTPLWFHRLDEQGELLECDFLWPIVHYERTTQGGDDFRIRPLYRRVTEPELQAVEHQFLWPFGRVRSDPEESSQRLFPLWSYRSRVNGDGQRDVDWYAIFPLFWGGWNDAGDEDYFAFFPLYADIPQFLTYDRFRTILWPLWVGLDKEGHHHSLFLWPFIGVSSCAEGGHSWFRIFPLYGHDIDPGRRERRFLLWPFFSWGWENQDSSDPVWALWIWPFFGIRTSDDVDGLTFLWPLFEKTSAKDRFYKLNVLWPLFHYFEDETNQNTVEWWLFPFIGHATSDDQDNWSLLWPLIWWRRYDDPEVTTEQQWILPLFWHIDRTWTDGSSEDYFKLWPFVHRTVRRDPEGRKVGGDWSILSPFPWRDGNATGVEEIYGFLWQVVAGRHRAPHDRAVDVLGRVFTRRSRDGATTASVPFLFNYEKAADGAAVLRLLQFLPIPLGGGATPTDPAADAVDPAGDGPVGDGPVGDRAASGDRAAAEPAARDQGDGGPDR